MSSDGKKSSELSRITFSLDLFDEKVIDLMAKKRKQSRSETVRNILHNWVESNAEVLKNNYDIDLTDVSREVEITNYEEVIRKSIDKLIKYSDLFEEIGFGILADQLGISHKTLRDIIFDYKQELENKGINLRIKGNLIIKEK